MFALHYVALVLATITLGAFHALKTLHSNFSTWDSVCRHAPQVQLNRAINA